MPNGPRGGGRAEGPPDGAVDVPPAVVIEVLLELVQSAGVRLEAETVAARLQTRGVAVSADHVDALFGLYGGKKRPTPP